jgi:hypothetical protein
VKSTSRGLTPPSAGFFSHVQASVGALSAVLNGHMYGSKDLLEGLAPQEHSSPLTEAFSVAARSQVQAPAGRARHEQRAPEIWFSVSARPQVQFRADCWPQEHLAWVALGVSVRCSAQTIEWLKVRGEERRGEENVPQTQPWAFFPQQVDGTTILTDEGLEKV